MVVSTAGDRGGERGGKVRLIAGRRTVAGMTRAPVQPLSQPFVGIPNACGLHQLSNARPAAAISNHRWSRRRGHRSARSQTHATTETAHPSLAPGPRECTTCRLVRPQTPHSATSPPPNPPGKPAAQAHDLFHRIQGCTRTNLAPLGGHQLAKRRRVVREQATVGTHERLQLLLHIAHPRSLR